MFKGSKLYSILFNKCPRCHEGQFFKNPPYHPTKFGEINARCSVCDESLERETGFYFGAMYVSYAFYVALTVTAFVGFVVLLDFEVIHVLAVLIPLYIILMPLFFRTARLVWINIFVNYKKDAAQHH
ncbi:MAG: DUF983 domain-containing protein [Spirosomataceae bacterium]|mgnify:CR=1 FL=1